MATEAQINANRQNAQKSTGPKTPAGKAAVRLNAFTHGLTSMSPVAPGEDPAEFQAFYQNFLDEFQPVGIAEENCVYNAAVSSWRLRRVAAIEAGYYEIEGSKHPDHSPAARLAYAHYPCARQLDSLSRTETRLHRTYEKSLHELERLQAGRPSQPAETESPNQSQSVPQPDENKEPAPTCEPVLDFPEGGFEPFEPLSPEEREKTLALIDHIFSKIPKVA